MNNELISLLMSDLQVKGKAAHLATGKKIRDQGLLATVFCNHCVQKNKTCWVSNSSARCAKCCELGRTVEECGVDNSKFRHTKDRSNSEISDWRPPASKKLV